MIQGRDRVLCTDVTVSRTERVIASIDVGISHTNPSGTLVANRVTASTRAPDTGNI